jgi:PAS domain S-box-containing protein
MSQKPDDFAGYCHYIIEPSPLPMIAVRGATHIVHYVNPAFCRLAGKAQEELLGRPFTEAVPEGTGNGCLALLDRVYLTGEAEMLADQEHIASSPADAYWSYTAWVVIDVQERPASVMLQVTDTTQAALLHARTVAMNEALVVFGMRHQELTEALNVRLQRAMIETHHRVKNNLQVIITLAEIPLIEGTPTVPASVLERTLAHIRTLAALHDILTQQMKTDASENTLDIQVTLNRLMPLLQNIVGIRRLHYAFAPVRLSIQKTGALSMLVSELVSNAHKHGAGDITVTLQHEGNDIRLVVSDEGKGFPDDFNSRTDANTGMDIVATLTRHDLQGELQFSNRPEGGAYVCVTFPVGTKAGSSTTRNDMA